MYKHQIKSLVLAAAIGLSAGFQVQAGDNGRSRALEYAGTFCLITIGIMGLQSIWNGMVSKEARLLDNLNGILETARDDYHIVRDQNRVKTMQAFGAGYNDVELQKLKFSNDTRKLVAFNRDKKRDDGKFTDLEMTRVKIKQEKQEKAEKERIAKLSLTWKKWLFRERK